MAGLEQLVHMIYHERQQEGSNLCAQHALNSLLQGNYFSAPDLSEFARKLDALEQSSRYDDANRARTSTNMDDTGFFSVQVLEEALNIWNLSLVRWRSEAMRPYQNEPHNQTAFVLNQNQHWYTLRRFGDLSVPGDGHWFNLDSNKRRPQWISKLYLGMFLQQAESDGYSVFTVTQIDPDSPSQLPHIDADDIASTFPDPTSASSSPRDDVEPGLENEDMELQAALQASLAGAGEPGGSWSMPVSYPPAQSSLFASDIRRSGSTRGVMPGIPPNQDPYGNADVDPITASMERDRVLMERMRYEQELGFRQQYEEEAARFRSRQPPRGPQARDDSEEEHFRRAIADSLAERHARGELDDNDDDDDPEDLDYVPSPQARMPYSTGQLDRVYDDDDADFQAALKASLENAPSEFTPLPVQPLRTRQAPSPHISAAVEDNEIDNQSEADTITIASESEASGESVSVEEMRRRRLARFGG
ncbi:Josephin-domain-containing protein [Suillus subalutaceus]|uniref:Josephin-domain-containing protein n=1 Tax=Suillus subalutaceus TaxID=48586 RepID=UPI001B87795F|nr:Josephin-domain-containing protein [Suillus subalutaceus]KAG1870159.1 Josephin-domain-containing protein [Suillus subalutaceus]